MRHFQEISQLQRELNIIIGRDTVNDPDKKKWFHDYAVALHDESTELFNCCNWKWWTHEGQQDQYKKIIDLSNAKIEAIDCLHFLVSLTQIHNYNFPENLEGVKENFKEKFKDNDEKFAILAKYLIIFSTDLISFDYKDSISVEKDCETIEFDILMLMVFLMNIFDVLEMSDDDILKIYKMKHEKNILRQKNGYSVKTKTEEDNNEIKNQL